MFRQPKSPIMRQLLPAFLAALMLATPALAMKLTGQEVTFRVETWDDPEKPLFVSKTQTATVTAKPEFGLRYEREVNEMDVVPMRVDVGESRVEFTYTEDFDNELYKARFNGYVLTFDGPCMFVIKARVDQDFTNIPLDNKRVRTTGRGFTVNVAGLVFRPGTRFAVDLRLSPCD